MTLNLKYKAPEFNISYIILELKNFQKYYKCTNILKQIQRICFGKILLLREMLQKNDKNQQGD